MKTNIHINALESLSFAWVKFKENWKTFSLVYLIMFGVGLFVGFLQGIITAPYQDPNSINNDLLPNTPMWVFLSIFILTVANMTISIFFGYNMLKMVFKTIDNQKVAVGDLFKRIDKTFWKWMSVTIVIAIMIIGIVAIAFAVGIMVHWSLALLVSLFVIYFVIKYFFATYLVIDGKELSVGQALKTSAHMTSGIEWQLIGFGLIVFAINVAIIIAGFVALIVGIIPAMVVASWLSPIAMVYMYRSVYAQKFGSSNGKVEDKLEM